MKVHCTKCREPLAYHCPTTNRQCGWLICLNAACRVRYFDTDRGLVQYTSGAVEGWDQQPASSEPTTFTVDEVASEFGVELDEGDAEAG